LLADWILALIVIAGVYAAWNSSGLRLRVKVTRAVRGHGSPVEELPEHLLRAGPLPVPIFEGDTVEIEVGLDTTGARRGPGWIKGKLGSSEISTGTGLVPRNGWRQAQDIRGVRRGPIGATSWTVGAGDPWGLFAELKRYADAEAALVLPRFTSLSSTRQVHELEAVAAAPRAGSGTELFGVREYRPGDSLRRIHWRSSARHGQLVVREFEPPGVRTLGIFVDPAPRSVDVADQIARIAASEAWDCIREGGRVVLWGPGLEPTQPSEARSLWALLEWLARYPAPSGRFAATSPASGEVVAITAGDPRVVDALEDVKDRRGGIRVWVIGESELAIDAEVHRVGTKWPL
jgi:uncharacterized protein (DUF58 family)